ncbi:MAG TPA: DUF6701 domain-containing protein, partial [Cellvibrio sp.]|nr:DUF6701 domain-containing protein [Cellvibrio sp.]
MNNDLNIAIFSILRRFALLIFISVTFFSPSLKAAECSAVFPSGAANSTNAGSVTIQWGADILNSPGNDIVTRNLYQYALWGCGFLALCDETNSISAQATDFNNFPNAANISVPYQATRNMTPGNYGSITTNSRVTLNFAPGDYTVRGDLNLGSETVVNVSSVGTVRLFVQGNVVFNAQSDINLTGSNRYFYVYTRGSFSLVSGAQARAVIYAKGNADLGNNTTLTGAVTSEAAVNVQNGATLNYSSSIIASADFGGSCGVVAPVITTFVIDTGGSTASTCTPKNITITARDGSNNILTGYTGTISISTSTGRGTWAKTNVIANANGTLVPGNDNGQAIYTFTATDAGDIVLALNNQRAQSLTITIADSGAGISATSSPVTFSDNAFVIASANASWGEDVVGMRDHPFTATMMRRDTNGACGAATGYNVPNLRMWLTRHGEDPVNSAAPSAVIGASVVSLPNTQPAANNVTLSFTDGVASFTLRTTDVGKYAINLADTSNSFASSTISGSSNTLVVRPFAIRIQVTENAAATSASGLTFRKAGQPFTVTVTGVGWQAADDADQDGMAEGHGDFDPANNADLSNNSALVRFAAPITLGSKLLQPVSGSESALTVGTFSSFSSGTASFSNNSFGEVGIIEITAALSGNTYLSSPVSNKIVGRSGYVGRFYPDHFGLSATAVQPSCNAVLPYSYLEEPFS